MKRAFTGIRIPSGQSLTVASGGIVVTVADRTTYRFVGDPVVTETIDLRPEVIANDPRFVRVDEATAAATSPPPQP